MIKLIFEIKIEYENQILVIFDPTYSSYPKPTPKTILQTTEYTFLVRNVSWSNIVLHKRGHAIICINFYNLNFRGIYFFQFYITNVSFKIEFV